MKLNIDRVMKRLNILGSISDDSQCLSRFYGTRAHNEAAELIKSWMEDAGLNTYKDTIGNVRGRLSSFSSTAKHFVIGSHYDTVFDAGKFDGPLGILLGIEMAQKASEMKLELPFHLNIIAFADEEGARFGTAYLGSSAVTGNFVKNWLNREDKDGNTIADVVKSKGDNPNEIFKEHLPKEEWLGYFEAHIEQGPVLCKENLSVAIVKGIAAQTRVEVHWIGVSGHAGTSPMNLRSDALCAASEFALVVEDRAVEEQHRLVATIGKFEVRPNTSNVIPGSVSHSLDIRSLDSGFLSESVERLEAIAAQISNKRRIGLEWKIMQSNPDVGCDPMLQKILAKAIQKTGVHEVLEIPSGAGHDGVMISQVAPIAMLFVRCTKGISHNPAEHVTDEDIKAALNVCFEFLIELIGSQA